MEAERHLTPAAWKGYWGSVNSLWTRRVETATIALIFLAGLWFFFGQLVLTRFDAVPGDLGDSRFNAILLEHGFRHLRGDDWHQAFWSPSWAFYPHKNILAYSDNLLGTLPIYSLARAFGLREFAAFNAWLVVIAVANFFAMLLFLRGIQLSRLGAALGGFVFAFAMPRGEQLNHLQLFPQFFTPLCLMCVTQLHTLRPWTVWGAVVCAVLQLYAAVYLGWFLALALGVCLLVTLVLSLFSAECRDTIRVGLKQLWLSAIAAAALASLALIPLGIHYSRAQAEVGPRIYDEIRNMLPRVSSYFLPSDYTFLYAPMLKLKQGIPVAHEHVMFAGFLVLICTLLMLASLFRRPREFATRWWKLALLSIWMITIVITLWVDGSLWNTLHKVIPGGGAIRAVSRITLLQLIPLGAAAAWAATWIERRAGILVAALFAGLVVLENSGVANYHFSVRDQITRVNQLKSQLAAKRCSTFFVTGTDESWKTQLDAMWASIDTKIPTINGYSGNIPPAWPFEDLRNVRQAALRRWLLRHHKKTDGLCMFAK